VIKQTDTDFTLWIGLDGMSPQEVATAIGGMPDADWIIADPGMTPADVRQKAIATMSTQCDRIVFVDSDDVLMPSRVAAAKHGLDESDVYACALRIIDRNGQDTGAVFTRPSDVDWNTFLPRWNVFGLSNSAFRTTVLKQCPPIPSASVLIDWFLVTQAWRLGARFSFDDQAHMLYRQYGSNTARVCGPFSESVILQSTKLVRDHYRLLLSNGASMGEPHDGQIREAARHVDLFDSALAGSAELRERYVRELNRLTPEYIWFWSVANPALEWIWHPNRRSN
jgi:hypothetical protein